jgi:hypothetical protein
MSRVYVTNIGSPNERTRKQYATSAGAKQRCRAALAERKQWCDAFNRTLGAEVADVSKAIDEMNITSMPPNVKHHWVMTDDHSGITLVVELWVEER